MGKFYESKLYHFAQLVYELVKLNVVAVVCSLPVVTAGAAWAALYCGIDAMADGSASPVSGEVSTAAQPPRMMPSKGIRSPGLTMMTAPTSASA